MKTFTAHLTALLLAATLAAPSVGWAVTASCGADALQNTQTVLCGNGTCTPGLVRLTTPLSVTAGGCEFDLNGRDLSIEKTFEMTGSGFIKVIHAKNITITAGGKLHATGDFDKPNGYIIQGGLISLIATGTITVDNGSGAGLDVSGDGAGTVILDAGGDITLAGGGNPVLGNGISSFADQGDRFTDGGELNATSRTGNVVVAADLSLTGQNGGTGGFVELQAAINVDVQKMIDVSGGGGGGGEVDLTAGDDVLVKRSIDADSSVGGGDGGTLAIDAGEDPIGGLKPGGDVRIDGDANIILGMQGSATDTFGGYGGDFEITAVGLVLLDNVTARLDAATNFDGDGGYFSIDSSDVEFYRLGPTDGDLQILGGLISMTSGNTGGDGGTVDLTAGRDMQITADMNVHGFDTGGDVTGTAGRAITLGGLIDSTGGAASGAGDGGYVDFESGLASDEGALGNLSVAKNVLAFGGALSGSGQVISLVGCGLSIAPAVKIDGHAGVSAANVPGGSDIDLTSRRPMTFGAGAQVLANPAGTITISHPPGQNPIGAAGATFNPQPIEKVITTGGPNCPVCGDGVRQTGEVCDKGLAADGSCCNATCDAFTCPTVTATPTATASRTPTPTRTATPTPTRTATPTLTPSPTETATPLATETPTPLPTETLLPTETPVPPTATPVPTPAPTAADVTAGIADAVAAKAAVKCQQSIEKAGVSYLAARLKQLDGCAAGILKCVQTKPDDPSCIPAAATKCNAGKGAATASRAKLVAALQGKCGTTAVSDGNLRGASGLGYDALNDECTTALGHAPAGVGDVAECIARRYDCRAGELYGTSFPRVGELMRVAGVTADAGTCLPDHEGNGEGVGDPVQGKAIHACSVAITKAANGFIAKKLASLTKCVDKVFACIQTKPGDAACLAKANAACGKEAAKIAAERAKLPAAVDKKCGGIDFNQNLLPPRAANLAALASTLPGSDTLDTLTHYEQALRLRHDCAADDLLNSIAPRAVPLLGAVAPSLPVPSAGCSAP